MTISSSSRPSDRKERPSPQWWMNAQQRDGMMMPDSGGGYHAQRGDY